MKAIYRREEIFKGKHDDTAPDILMEPAEQYSLTHARWMSGEGRECPNDHLARLGPGAAPADSQRSAVERGERPSAMSVSATR